MEKENDVLTYTEACDFLSISYATLKNWIRLGKIIPDTEGNGFSRKYLTEVVRQINSGETKLLKNRRNKTGISGAFLYKNYSLCEDNKKAVCNLLNNKAPEHAEIHLLLANIAAHLYCQKNGIEMPEDYILPALINNFKNSDFTGLLSDLIGETDYNTALSPFMKKASVIKFKYVPGEDTLGFVYISLKDIGQRKSGGIYYTPKAVVEKMVSDIVFPEKSEKISFFDPCCGTGNFLIAINERFSSKAELYGQDCDPLNVYITRINLFLCDSSLSESYIKSHIIIGNTLLHTFHHQFDVVIGNPPWGSSFLPQELSEYRKKYISAQGKSVESCDLFLEKGLNLTKTGGILYFVIPEAILNVSAHRKIRRILMNICRFKSVSYIGNVFSGVQCPSVLLQVSVEHSGSVLGCRVSTPSESFIISQERKLSPDFFSFQISDNDMEIIEKMNSIQNPAFLKNHSKFALGIVTGNNSRFLINQKRDGYEPIIKGSDVYRYSIGIPKNYIQSIPDKFQQTAPLEMYKAREKLVYRFICRSPVFAYDTGGLLTLNSCNILIPEIPGFSIKYILTILNSSAVDFWISKKYYSSKLLKSHIENIPIPAVSQEKQKQLESYVNEILANIGDVSALYKQIDDIVYECYELSEDDKTRINEFLKSKNKYLKTAA